jgi:cytochrome c-type biogenesis protein CcmH/NrfG
VKTFDGKVYPVKLILAEKQDVDLIKVLVDIPEKTTKFVQVTNTVPEVAERVLVVGSPMGLDQTVSEGIVSAVRDIPTIGKIFQISAPISLGSSGSPVVNMEGKVIGVATFQSIEGQNLNFAVSGEHVLALKSEKKRKTLSEWSCSAFSRQMESAESLYLKGMEFLVWTSEYEKALGFFKKALQKNSRFAEAWYWAASCYNWLDRHEEAVEAYKQAIDIKPDYAIALNDLAVTYTRLARYYEAIKILKQAIHLKLDFARTHYLLGHTYVQFDRYHEALEAYKQAIRMKPDFAEAHWRLGGVYGQLGRYKEEADAYKQAIRIKPDLAKAHYMLGLTYLQLGDKGSALEEYKILKTLDKDLANQLFNLIYD